MSTCGPSLRSLLEGISTLRPPGPTNPEAAKGKGEEGRGGEEKGEAEQVDGEG